MGIVNINISNTIDHIKLYIYGLDIFLSSSVHIDGNTVTKIALQSHSRDNSGGIFIDDEYNIVINNTISMYNTIGTFITGINKHK